jgi:hypothetical protein
MTRGKSLACLGVAVLLAAVRPGAADEKKPEPFQVTVDLGAAPPPPGR